jgi:hypothetical protein
LLTNGLYLKWHIISEIMYLLTYLHTYIHTYLPTYLLTYLLSPWISVVLEKVTGFQVFSPSRNSPHSMEPEGSLPHSQVTAICPYPEPPRSSPFGIMYCLHLQQYLKVCRNIFVSAVQLVCSNVQVIEKDGRDLKPL